MTPDSRSNHDGVSPVVGVMLMLVVTIIIAAVVSAFSGGLTESNEKAQPVKISADFSQSKGMNIYHEGGPSLPLYYTNIIIRGGRDSIRWESISYEVNHSVVGNMDSSCMWSSEFKLPTTTCSLYYFKPGDVAHVAPEYLSETQTRKDGTVDYFNSARGMGHENMIGNQVMVELYDTQKGKIIASAEMTISP